MDLEVPVLLSDVATLINLFFSTFTIRNHWLNLPCWLAGLAISPLSTGPLRPPRKYMKNYQHKWGN